jgi:AraC-like DNA-binding protein
VSVLRRRVACGERLAPLGHGALTLTLVVAGTVRVADDIVTCVAGEILLHDRASTGLGQPLIAVTDAELLELRFAARWSSALIPEKPCVIRAASVTRLAREIRAEMDARLPGFEHAVAGLARALLERLRRREGATRHGAWWLERARRLLRERARDKVVMCDIAAEIGVHPVHLSRAFHAHFGMTMREYLLRVRVELATAELRRAPRSLSAVGLASGFVDHGHFTRSFKRVTGMTPSAFRAHADRELARAPIGSA